MLLALYFFDVCNCWINEQCLIGNDVMYCIIVASEWYLTAVASSSSAIS